MCNMNPPSLPDIGTAISKVKNSGVILVKADPLTKNHLHLIRRASRLVENLVVAPVANDGPELFNINDRIGMLRRALRSVGNASLSAPVSPAEATNFATTLEDHSDLLIFTAENSPLAIPLRNAGANVVQLKRLTMNNAAISSAQVRRAIAGGEPLKALRFLENAALPYMLVWLAQQAIRTVLALPHYPALQPHDIDRICELMKSLLLSAADSGLSRRPDGVRMRQQMALVHGRLCSEAGHLTGLITPFLYVMPIAVTAAGMILGAGHRPGLESLRECFRTVGSITDHTPWEEYPEAQNRYCLRSLGSYGADGFEMMFDDWLKFLYERRHNPNRIILTLLRIIVTHADLSLFDKGTPRGEEMVHQAVNRVITDLSDRHLRETFESFARIDMSPLYAPAFLAMTLFTSTMLPSGNRRQ